MKRSVCRPRTDTVAAAFLAVSFLLAAPSAAQEQSTIQQGCINTLNKGGGKVAAARGKQNAACIKDAGKGKLTGTTDACLTGDAKGKVGKARDKNDQGQDTKCNGVTPDFGATDAATGSDAAEQQETALARDVFGDPVDPAIIDAATDKAGAGCQASVSKAYEKLAAAKLKSFLKCKKDGLKGKSGTAFSSSADLESCVTAIAGDAKVAKTAAKLDDTVAKKCPSPEVDTDAAFPGECAGTPDFATCVDERVECRACLMLNAMDALAVDCDQFVDGVPNGSCGSTTTTTVAVTTTMAPTTTLGGTTTTLPDGVYVSSTNGSPGASGTPGDPVDTIGEGIALGAAQVKPVFVQAGSYSETLEPESGVLVKGGFDESWTEDDRTAPGHEVIVTGGLYVPDGQYITVVAHDVSGVRLENLTLVGADASGTFGTGQGRSSYVVHASTSDIELENVRMEQGDGASGATGGAGNDASNTAAPGGGPGGNAHQAFFDCNITDRGAGGTAGVNLDCNVATSGGAGGAGGTMDTTCVPLFPSGMTCGNCDATAGDPGTDGEGPGGSGGGGGAGTTICGPGGPGGNGLGTGGTGGTGAAAGGRLVGLYWAGRDGEPGMTGSHGQGGGGGGGSGGCDPGTDSWGAGGGGGGAGGCRAPSAGEGGGGAGGSFGVFAVGSTVDVTNCELVRASGGTGGVGGVGGAGQLGGSGGLGGAGAGGSQAGGLGGSGGPGGDSGAGGGGGGGHSFGIYTESSTVNQSGNTFSSGTAGSGGGAGADPAAGVPATPATAGQSGTLGTVGTCASPAAC